MELILKISIIILLVSIFMQDLKSRSVSIMLFITLGVLMTILHYKNISKTEFIYYITFNISIVFIVMSVLYAYSRLKMSKNIQEVFGMGDFMFFIIMAIGLPAVSFLVLFSFSILFSGVVYFIFKKRLGDKTVPLAGLQSLFMALMFIVDSLGILSIYI